MKKIITKGLKGAEFADRLQEYREDIISMLDYEEDDCIELLGGNEDTLIQILNKLIVDIEDETEGTATIEDAVFIINDQCDKLRIDKEKEMEE